MRKFSKNLIYCLLFLFASLTSYGQLSNFTLTVTATNETCTANGTLNFNVSGTNPAATVTYTIFLLPNTTTPFRTVSTNSLSGLNAGNYRIVATQSLGTANNSQQRDVSILNQVRSLEFNMAASDASACGPNGVITVTVTSGNPVSYEIISGPMTRPLQPSNVFTNLVSGSYLVRVHDACGNAVSRSHTLVVPQYISNGIQILVTDYPSAELVSCNQIKIGHSLQILPNYYVAFPLALRFTVRPPTGPPIVVDNIINGNSGRFGTTTIIPADGTYETILPYYSTAYSYDLVVTDACGRTYTRDGNVVNRPLTATLSYENTTCGRKLLKVGALNHRFPIRVDFLTFPAGFDPVAYQAGHPNFGDFPTYGTPIAPVPAGNYSIRITDACGKTSTASTVIVNELSVAIGVTNTCASGPEINIMVPGSRIISVFITVAPPGFPFPLEYNAGAYINSLGEVHLTGILIPGFYEFRIKDECLNEYLKQVTVPGVTPPTINISYAGSCQPGFGSIYLGRNPSTTNLRSVIFTAVPPAYPASLSRNVSAYIRGSYLMMDGLPTGNYQVEVTDACNITVNISITVREYVGNTTVNVNEMCSSFDLFLSHSNTNTITNLGYWIQKFDAVSGRWGHPFTGIPYVENTIPNVSNAIALTNASLNNNLGAGGKYRVLTASSLFNLSGATYCIRTLREFETGAVPVINQVLSTSCSGNLSDVFLDVTATGPLSYKILEKNGQSFPVDNLNNPLFTGLQIGVYLFQIEDQCGNRSTIRHDVSAPFVFTVAPLLCNGLNSSLSVPDFSYLRYEWYKQGQESTILSRTATLNFIPLNLTAHAGIYHVKITYPSNLTSCLNQVLNYTINAGSTPNAGNDNLANLCTVPTSINLFDYLSGSFDPNGSWQQVTPGGTLSGNAWDLTGITSGFYQFKYIVNGFCGVKDEATISFQFGSTIPAPILSNISAVCLGEPVSISISNVNILYTYSWTGPNGFTSNAYNPTFPNATLDMAGDYFVTASLGAGCSSPVATVRLTVKPLPEFHLESTLPAICEQQKITLSAKGHNFDENAANYIWYLDGNEILRTAIPEIEVSSPGLYKAITTFDGCSNEATIQIDVSTSSFEVGTKVGCENDLYMLSAFALNNSFIEANATYEWSGPNNFSSTLQSVDVSGLDSGEYKVTVTNESGCKSEGKIYVQKAFCKIPKGVSPNGDGANDTWDLSGLDIEKVKIFNRYGTEVFELRDYINQWNGQAKNGNLLPSATYYYYIKFRSGHEKTGWVYLNREVN